MIIIYPKGIPSTSNSIGDTSNRGKKWTDEELKVVLSFVPTYNNCIMLANAFKRGWGSIAQIHGWRAAPKKKTDIKNNTFINQIKKVGKQMNYRP
jgi:hypothetical protein